MFKFQSRKHLGLAILVISFFSCGEGINEDIESTEKNSVIIEEERNNEILPPTIVDNIIMSKIDSTIDDHNYYSYWSMDSLSIESFLEKVYTNQVNGYLFHTENQLGCSLYNNGEIVRELNINKGAEFSYVGEGFRRLNMINSSFLDSIYNNSDLIEVRHCR